jgi:hypothetical protein
MHAHRRIQRSSVALAAIAILWTAAPARASHIPLGIATPAHQDLRSPDARDIAEGRPSPADIVTLVRLVPDHRARPPQARGFDLRDAAVGAAAATGLILLLAGSVLRFRRHRNQLFSVVIQRSL